MTTKIAAGRVFLERFHLRNFRNIEASLVEPARRLNVFFGDNGQGKTSVVEALYVLATTRSFRCQKLGETVREGESHAEVRARVSSLGLDSELAARLSLRGRSFLCDGKAPKRRLDYALRTPVIAFHPGDLALVSGPASLRRTLLDRVVVYLDPPGAEARLRYQEALVERQKILEERGLHASELGSYETVIAQHGARFALARRRAVDELVPCLTRAFGRMAPGDVPLEVTYAAAGSTDAETFAAELHARRAADQRRGGATFGPHRDELALTLSGRPARSHASQGQQRLLTLSSKLAELEVVRRATEVHPMLLLDDVSSELDAARTQAVFDFLRDTESQVFVTTTRPELFRDVEVREADRRAFFVDRGRVEEARREET
jgi:DNA replication and repair protein RecF